MEGGEELLRGDWSLSAEYLKCANIDTRFIESYYEMSLYECNVCG